MEAVKENLLWSNDLVMMDTKGRKDVRLSIFKDTLVLEQKEEISGSDPVWRNRSQYRLPSKEDVRIRRNGLFSKKLTINLEDNEIDFLFEGGRLDVVLEEIRTAILIGENLRSPESRGILSMVGKKGSVVVN
jgi:hypothetical protein